MLYEFLIDENLKLIRDTNTGTTQIYSTHSALARPRLKFAAVDFNIQLKIHVREFLTLQAARQTSSSCPGRATVGMYVHGGLGYDFDGSGEKMVFNSVDVRRRTVLHTVYSDLTMSFGPR